MSFDRGFTKENLDVYLKELAKEFRKLNGKSMPAENLYGSYELLPEDSRVFIERAIEEGKYEQTYQRVRQMEAENKDILLQFQKDYPGVTNTDNVNDILAAIRRKKEGTSAR